VIGAAVTEDEAMDTSARDLLEARFRLGEIAPSDLHALADRLLASGEDADELIALFALDRDQLRWQGAEALERLLRAWGGGDLSPAAAVPLVERSIARSLVDGTVTPLEAVKRFHAIDVRTNYAFEGLSRWRDLHEELAYVDRRGRTYIGRQAEEAAADVMALARAVLAEPASP